MTTPSSDDLEDEGRRRATAILTAGALAKDRDLVRRLIGEAEADGYLIEVTAQLSGLTASLLLLVSEHSGATVEDMLRASVLGQHQRRHDDDAQT